jgi:hypothetical protein
MKCIALSVIYVTFSLHLGHGETPAALSAENAMRRTFPQLLEVPGPVENSGDGKIDRIWTDGRFCVAGDGARAVHCGHITSFRPLAVEWAFKGDLSGAAAEYGKYQRTLYAGETLGSALQKLGHAGFRDVSSRIAIESFTRDNYKWNIDRFYETSEDRLLLINYLEFDGRILIRRLTDLKVDHSGRNRKRILESNGTDQFLLPVSTARDGTAREVISPKSATGAPVPALYEAFATLMDTGDSAKVNADEGTSPLLTDGRFCVAEDPAGAVFCGRIISFKPMAADWTFKGGVPGAIAEYEKYRRTLYVGESPDSALRKLACAGYREIPRPVGVASTMPGRYKWQASRYYECSGNKLLMLLYVEYDGRIIIERIVDLKVEARAQGGEREPERIWVDEFVLPASVEGK